MLGGHHATLHLFLVSNRNAPGIDLGAERANFLFLDVLLAGKFLTTFLKHLHVMLDPRVLIIFFKLNAAQAVLQLIFLALQIIL